MAGMESRIKLCVWLFGVAGAALIVTSCVTTYWQEWGGFHEGIWQHCGPIFGCSKINVYTDGDDERNGVKALMVIGIVLIAITMLVDIGGVCCGKKMFVPMLVIQVIAIACVAGALALYTNKLEKDVYDWGWSYKLGWAGVGLYGIGFIFVGMLVCGM